MHVVKPHARVRVRRGAVLKLEVSGGARDDAVWAGEGKDPGEALCAHCVRVIDTGVGE